MKHSRLFSSLGAAALALSLSACGGSPETTDDMGETESMTADAPEIEAKASAPLMNADGERVGEATLTQQGSDLALKLVVMNMPEGTHGVHIHTVGKCDAPDFKTAGGHWNPNDKQHGLDNMEGHHEGDLPNLEVAADGTGTLDATIDSAGISAGENVLLDADGSAFVVHAGEDDQRTDPSGDSGARIACGVFAETVEAAPAA